MHIIEKNDLMGVYSHSDHLLRLCIWRMPFSGVAPSPSLGGEGRMAYFIIPSVFHGACHPPGCVSSEGRMAYFIISSVFHGACHPPGRVSGEVGIAYFIIPYGIHGTCHSLAASPCVFTHFLFAIFLYSIFLT